MEFDKFAHTRLVVKRPLPGLHRVDNGVMLVMAHGTLYLRFPAWIGRMIWRWRQHHRARQGLVPTFADVSGLPLSAEARRELIGRGYKEHEAWRRSVFYKGVDVRADPGRRYYG